MVLAGVHSTYRYCASLPQNRFCYCNLQIVAAHFRTRPPGDKLLSWHSSLLKPKMIKNESDLKCSSKQYIMTKATANPKQIVLKWANLILSSQVRDCLPLSEGTEKDIKAMRLNTSLLGNTVKIERVNFSSNRPIPKLPNNLSYLSKTLTSLLQHATSLYNLHYYLARHMQ